MTGHSARPDDILIHASGQYIEIISAFNRTLQARTAPSGTSHVGWLMCAILAQSLRCPCYNDRGSPSTGWWCL